LEVVVVVVVGGGGGRDFMDAFQGCNGRRWDSNYTLLPVDCTGEGISSVFMGLDDMGDYEGLPSIAAKLMSANIEDKADGLQALQKVGKYNSIPAAPE